MAASGKCLVFRRGKSCVAGDIENEHMFRSLLYHLFQCLFRIGQKQGNRPTNPERNPMTETPIKSAAQQIREIQEELTRNTAEEEAMIRAKFGNSSVKRNVYAYAEEPAPVAKFTSTKKGGTPPLERVAPTDNMKYETTVKNKETGEVETVTREIDLVNFPRYVAILTAAAEHRLVTLAHLVEAMFPATDGILLSEAEKLKKEDSVRTSNISKLVKGGYLEKHTVQGKAAYGPTEKGNQHLEYVVPAYNAKCSPDTAFEIVNHSTLAVDLGAPNNKGLMDPKETGTLVPGFPVLTRQRLLTSAKPKFASKRLAEDQQILEVSGFLKLDVMPTVDATWNRNSMTPNMAHTILRTLQTPQQIKVETRLGNAYRYIEPASLFQTYNKDGEAEHFVHMVVGMPNIIQTDPQTGRDERAMGCIAVRNELVQQTPEFYRYMILQVFLSHAGFPKFLIKSPYKHIQAAIHNVWLDMILKEEIPRHRTYWLGVEGYKPLNAGDEELNPFSPNRGRTELRNWSAG